MRTTVTLDPDVTALVKAAMDASQRGFKDVVNDALRAGLGGQQPTGYRTPTFDMGFSPDLPWDKALRIAAALEDEELTRRHATGN